MKKAVKNILCAMISAAMLLSSAPLAFAEDTGLDGAIAIAKTKLDIPEEYSEFSSDSSSQFGVQVYSLLWKIPDSDSQIRVSVSSKGDILNMRKYPNNSYNNESMSIPKISADEAKSTALSWLETVNPSWISQLDVDGASASSYSLYSSEYSVRFQRIVNGISVAGNNAYVNIDKNDGTVIEMSSNWSYPNEFADISGVISQSDAQNKLIENSPLELSYQYRSTDKTAVLVYIPKNTGIYINALDGTLVDQDEEYRNSVSGGGGTAMSAMAAEDAAADIEEVGKYQYTEEELAELDRQANLITSERAMEIFRGIKHIAAEKYNLSSYRYNTQKNSKTGEKTYTIYLSLSYASEDEEISYMNVTLDAESGELKYLNSYSYDYVSKNGEEKKYDAETAKKIANEFAEEYAPNEYPKTKLDESVFENIEEYIDYYKPAFSFYQWENDIIFRRNSVSVRVDNDGLVTYFNKMWDNDITFESPSGILSADEAAVKLFEQSPERLSYTDFSSYRSVSHNIIPVYTFGSASYRISAKNGKLLNYDNTEYTEKSKGTVSYENLTDISGHYAENAIKTLLHYEVIVLDENETKFRPDDVMTQTELLKFVEAAFSGYDYITLEDDNIYSIAKRRSIINDNEVNRNSQATRTDAAKFIVRALGFSEVAEISGIFDSGFSDRFNIPSGYEGYVAIAKGLKVVNGDENNCFNPNEPVTRGDAAIMIYNYLSR